MKLWSLCKFSFKIEKYCRNYQFPCIFLFLFEKFSLLDLDPQPWLEGGTCLQCCCVSAGSASWDGPLCAGTIRQSQFFKSFFLCHIYVGLRTWYIGTGANFYCFLFFSWLIRPGLLCTFRPTRGSPTFPTTSRWIAHVGMKRSAKIPSWPSPDHLSSCNLVRGNGSRLQGFFFFFHLAQCCVIVQWMPFFLCTYCCSFAKLFFWLTM